VAPGKINVTGVIPADPTDEIVLACAVEGQADLVVSGDHHLLDLGEYHGIPITTARMFLEQLKETPMP